MAKDQKLNAGQKYWNGWKKWNGPRASDSGSTNAKQPMKKQQRTAKKHWPATKYDAIYTVFTYLEEGHCSLIYANPQEISFCGFKVDKSVLQPVRLMAMLGGTTKNRQQKQDQKWWFGVCGWVPTHRFTPSHPHPFYRIQYSTLRVNFRSILLDRAPFPLFYALLWNILFLFHFYFLSLVCHCWSFFFCLAVGYQSHPLNTPQPFQPLGGVIKIHNSPRARNFSAPEFVGLISDVVFGATIIFNFWKTLPLGWFLKSGF